MGQHYLPIPVTETTTACSWAFPMANPTAWAEVNRIDDSSVTLRDSQVLDLPEVTAYFVAYPGGSLGRLRVPHNKLPLPELGEVPQSPRARQTWTV